CEVLAEILRGELFQLRDGVGGHLLEPLGSVGVQAQLADAGVEDEASGGKTQRKAMEGEGHRVAPCCRNLRCLQCTDYHPPRVTWRECPSRRLYSAVLAQAHRPL